MIENSKEERQLIGKVLVQLDIDGKSKEQLAQLMRALGFEEDVPFAKSLFSDTLAHIYKRHQGEYQKFTSTDPIAQLSSSTRKLLFKIFRVYHEHKLLGKSQPASIRSTIDHLSMPDPNNIQEIISFQKAMFQLFKHMIPNKQIAPPQPPAQVHNLKAFSPYPTYPQNNFPHFEPEFYPMQSNPYMQSMNNRSFVNSNFSFEDARGTSSMFPFNKADPLLDHHSLSLKRRSNQFPDLEQPFRQSISPLASSSSLREDNRHSRGFTAFHEEDALGQPGKKVKKDKLRVCPPNFGDMKRELENYKRNQNKANEQRISGSNGDSVSPINEGSMMIKQSVSEYLPEQVVKKGCQQSQNAQ